MNEQLPRLNKPMDVSLYYSETTSNPKANTNGKCQILFGVWVLKIDNVNQRNHILIDV